MLPWFLPAAAISVVVSIAASGAVGRALRVRRPVAWVMVLGLGIILAATLTPQKQALEFGARGSAHCDFTRIGLPSLEELLSANDSLGNILMFIPLGVTIALVPGARRKAAIMVGAIALPFAIETTQLLLPWIDRACETADVVDNLTGLAIGLAGGSVAGWLGRAVGRRPL
jgi:glycopeptide antibiotics resistance protein